MISAEPRKNFPFSALAELHQGVREEPHWKSAVQPAVQPAVQADLSVGSFALVDSPWVL